jgi:pyruvate/2-oxoglutarate/acetoin dehydrogenase E1 component
VGAEIVAAVAESGIPLLRPPVRLATPDVRIPAAPALRAAVIPNTEQLVTACTGLLVPVRAEVREDPLLARR